MLLIVCYIVIQVKPRVFEVRDEPHILLVAKRRIEVTEEVLLDYGDRDSALKFLQSCPVCSDLPTVRQVPTCTATLTSTTLPAVKDPDRVMSKVVSTTASGDDMSSASSDGAEVSAAKVMPSASSATKCTSSMSTMLKSMNKMSKDISAANVKRQKLIYESFAKK